MLTLAAALGLALASAHETRDRRSLSRPNPESDCSMARPYACEGAAEWIADDPNFKPAVINFFRAVPKHRFGYLGEENWEIFWRTIIHSDVGPIRVARGIYMFNGCTPHACPLNQASVVVGHGRIIAVALAGDLCIRCTPNLYIFTRRSEPFRQVGIGAIRSWFKKDWNYDSPILETVR